MYGCEEKENVHRLRLWSRARMVVCVGCGMFCFVFFDLSGGLVLCTILDGTAYLWFSYGIFTVSFLFGKCFVVFGQDCLSSLVYTST